MALFSRTLLTTLVLTASASVVAQDVPVIELGEAPAPVQSLPQSSAGSDVPELTIQTSGSLAGSRDSAGFGGSTEMLVLLQQLQDEVRSLRGQLESQGRKLKGMEDEQRDRYRDLDRRISFLMTEGGSGRPAAPAVKSPAAPSTGPATAAPPSSSPSTVASRPSADAGDAYSEAFALVRQSAYDDAIVAFVAFIKDYPASDYIANAHYWLGEVYLAQQKLEQARDAFSQVVALYADHRKAADATYKLGKVYAELGDKVKSAEYIDLVLSKYPDSSAARLARNFKSQ